eukprot:NODE_6393_length_284_cov_74.182979_g5781_i0.p1 GENE.NODE_6393_length_284_cov_74.182979_g5781_i0~~NODE_6393_length_284_cov_74.182979_g5781_i0.p1  ORF type:complete len:59 (-),score=19.27 NODE_6393_length_284_cov_74.182979_g5781_i0:107-259(-)
MGENKTQPDMLFRVHGPYQFSTNFDSASKAVWAASKDLIAAERSRQVAAT